MHPLFRITLATCVLLLAGEAHANLTFQILGPNGDGTSASDPQLVYPEKSANVGEGNTFSINAQIGASAAGNYGNVELILQLPIGVVFQSATVSGFTYQGCTPALSGASTANQVVTCRWLASNYQATVGVQENAVILKSVAMRRRNGQSDTISGTFGVVGAPNPVSDTHYIETRTTAGATVGDGSWYAHVWMSRYAVVNGVQGYVRQFLVGAGTVGGALPGGFSSNPIDVIRIRASLPAGSEATALRFVPGQTTDFAVYGTPTATSLELQNQSVWTTADPAYVGGGNANAYSTGANFLVEAFFPCANLPTDAGADLLLEISALVANDAAGNPLPTTIVPAAGASTALAFGNRACADAPLTDNPHVDGTQDPSEAGDLFKSQDSSSPVDNIDAGQQLTYDLTLAPPVGEPVLWDLFFVDRLPQGFWGAGAVATVSLSGPVNIVTHPNLKLYACDLSSTSLATTNNFTRADLQTALSFTNIQPIPCPQLTYSTQGITLPSGTTHYIIDAAQRTATGTPAPLPYDPATYSAAANDWDGMGALIIRPRLTFPLTITPTRTWNYAWHYATYSLGLNAPLGSPTYGDFKDLAGTIETFGDSAVNEAPQRTSAHQLNGPSSSVNTDPNTWVVDVLIPEVAGSTVIETRQPRNNPIAGQVPITLPNPAFVVVGFEGEGLTLPDNPTFVVNIPAGFTITSAKDNPSGVIDASSLGLGSGTKIFENGPSDHLVAANCGPGPTNPVTFSSVGDPTTGYTLTWTVNDSPPWKLRNDGNISVSRCAGVAFELIPASGSNFEDGDTIALTSALYSQGVSDPVATDSETRPLAASGAVDLWAYALACDPDGFTLSAVLANTGGKRFTEAGVRFTVPSALTASSVTLVSGDPAFMSSNIAFQYANDDGTTKDIVVTVTGASPGDTVLPPYTFGNFVLDVAWDPNDGTFGAVAQSFATAVDANDSPSNLVQDGSESDSIDPNTCPGALRITKTFAGNGLPMANVTFNLTGTDTNLSASTDASGVITWSPLTPGTYTLIENMATLPGTATWTTSLGGRAQTIVRVAAVTTTSLAVVNRCSCGAGPCQSASCAIDGTCTTVALADGTDCNSDDTLCTVEECQTGACVTVDNVTCSGEALCTMTQCDPDTGTCTDIVPVVPEICEGDVGAIVTVAVTGPDGEARYVVCGLYPPGFDGNAGSEPAWICLDDNDDGVVDLYSAEQLTTTFGADLCAGGLGTITP